MILSYKDFILENSNSREIEIENILNNTAESILTLGYGKPLVKLLEEPEFQVIFRGENICHYDKIYDRILEPLRRKDKVLKKVSWGERMIMLLIDWRNFNEKYNPDKLNFTEWINKEQTLYRGVIANDFSVDYGKIIYPKDKFFDFTKDNKKLRFKPTDEIVILDRLPQYSFSFFKEIAERFTIPGYNIGNYVVKRNANGYILEAKIKPKDFYIFGSMINDEMEAVIKSPIECKVIGRILNGIEITNI